MRQPKKETKAAKSQASQSSPSKTPFDPIAEYEDDEWAYDIQYYHDAIFAQHGTKEEQKYPYLITGNVSCCTTIEANLKGLAPLHIAQSYLFKDLLPIFGKKSRDYFETVLLETGSIEINHQERTTANKEYAFSKLIIKRILTPENWGIPLGQARQIQKFESIPNLFNYHDYIRAWENIFIYENPQRKHSWWVKFLLDNPTQAIPEWFHSFYFSWGGTPSIYPRKIKEIWRKFHTTNKQLNSLQAVLQFAVNYNVPWIVKWDYQIQEQNKEKNELSLNSTMLVRRILTKWWAKEDFFAEGRVYDKRGVLSLSPAKQVMTAMNAETPTKKSLLKELLQNMEKDEVANLYEEIYGKSPTQTTASSTQPSTSSAKGKEVMDTDMMDQDSQNPYEEDDLLRYLTH